LSWCGKDGEIFNKKRLRHDDSAGNSHLVNFEKGGILIE
jgi:hypothetical protein